MDCPIYRTLDVLLNGLAEKVSYKFNLLVRIYSEEKKRKKEGQKSSDQKLMRGIEMISES
jgi:hypothetical protein